MTPRRLEKWKFRLLWIFSRISTQSCPSPGGSALQAPALLAPLLQWAWGYSYCPPRTDQTERVLVLGELPKLFHALVVSLATVVEDQ